MKLEANPQANDGARPHRKTSPIVIAHRGASGYLPEHTVEAYQLAIDFGADYIEPDLVITKDGHLVARHENEISSTTDVSEHPDFADRLTTKIIDGRPVTGWFTEDFTLEELKTLRARERLPQLRAFSRSHDGDFRIPSFAQILGLVQRNEAKGVGGGSHRIGVYPETKHPSYFAGIGLPFEARLIDALESQGYSETTDPIYIQSFEFTNLRQLSDMTKLPLVFLADTGGAPQDFLAADDSRSYADLMTNRGLEELASFATTLGAHKDLICPKDGDDRLQAPTSLVADAHAAGLQVHAWTFRAENYFLPAQFRRGNRDDAGNPSLLGDLDGEIRAFLDAGIDGFFTDHANLAVAAVKAWTK